MSSARSSAIGVILAGGRSTRMGGNDKAFVRLAGRPLIDHVIERLRPQVAGLAINSNAPTERFAAYALPVVPDLLTGFRGPLAGVHAALRAYPDHTVLTVAVDIPLLPQDLVTRLSAALRTGRCAYAAVGGHHAAAILWSPGMAGEVEAALGRGEPSLKRWLARHGDPVEFPPSAGNDLGLNVNSPAELAAAERQLAAPT